MRAAVPGISRLTRQQLIQVHDARLCGVCRRLSTCPKMSPTSGVTYTGVYDPTALCECMFRVAAGMLRPTDQSGALRNGGATALEAESAGK
ncbi:hypothetical protein V5799_015951 [Amblyomma americanum]|uniref:Uncharacterized protein n=1 Tax=Amblyomma americanum TaxID=6943 RepID=A0AAQ4F6E0_AMBAM